MPLFRQCSLTEYQEPGLEVQEKQKKGEKRKKKKEGRRKKEERERGKKEEGGGEERLLYLFDRYKGRVSLGYLQSCADMVQFIKVEIRSLKS